MRPPQDEADDVGLDLKQAAPSQIGRASRSAVTPACSSPSADSPQETDEPSEPAAGPSNVILGDDSDEWDYDPFIDPDADPEPDDEPVDLPPSIQPRRHVAPTIPPPETSSLDQRLTKLLNQSLSKCPDHTPQKVDRSFFMDESSSSKSRFISAE